MTHLGSMPVSNGRADAPAMPGELLLLTPGPACTSPRVRAALAMGDMSHREPEFSGILDSVRERLPGALGLPEHEAVVVTASGTAVDEMAVIASVREGRSLLIVSNGVYGERLATIAARNRITSVIVSPPGDTLARWTTPVDVAMVRDAIHDHPELDAIACVVHETTTGMLNPVREIAEAARKAGLLVVLDAISATGIERPDLSTVDADIVLGTANKGLHGVPGIAFLLCSARAIERMGEVEPRSLYLDPLTHLTAQRRGEVPFTPAIQVLAAFEAALAEFIDEGGYAARSALYRRRGEIAREGFDTLGLRALVSDGPHRAASVTTLALPEGVGYAALHDALKRRGYVMYAGQGTLARSHFRICTFGHFALPRLEALTGALGESIEDARRQATAVSDGANR